MLAELAARWAGELRRRGDVGRGDLDAVARALREVQALPYTPDPPGSVDLLSLSLACVERVGGDCEERAALFAARCDAMRVRAAVVWVPQPWARLDHVSSQVMVQGRWCWADATVPGARLGEHPWDAARRLRSSEV